MLQLTALPESKETPASLIARYGSIRHPSDQSKLLYARLISGIEPEVREYAKHSKAMKIYESLKDSPDPRVAGEAKWMLGSMLFHTFEGVEDDRRARINDIAQIVDPALFASVFRRKEGDGHAATGVWLYVRGLPITDEGEHDAIRHVKYWLNAPVGSNGWTKSLLDLLRQDIERSDRTSPAFLTHLKPDNRESQSLAPSEPLSRGASPAAAESEHRSPANEHASRTWGTPFDIDDNQRRKLQQFVSSHPKSPIEELSMYDAGRRVTASVLLRRPSAQNLLDRYISKFLAQPPELAEAAQDARTSA